MARADLRPPPGGLINAFPLVIPRDTTLAYRIWTIDPVPRTDRLREKIRSYLWQTKLRRPVQPMYIANQYAYAVADWGWRGTVDYVGDGDRRYTISPSGDRREIRLDRLAGDEAQIAAAMLQAELDLHLRKDLRLARGHRASRFFLIEPDTVYAPTKAPGSALGGRRPEVDIFRGFRFRVVPIDGEGLCLVLDVLTSYIGRRTLAEYLGDGRVPTTIEAEWGFTRWVNDYGRTKQAIYLVQPENRSIGETQLGDGQSVFEYLWNVRPEVRDLITQTDRAATIIYRTADAHDETRHYTAAATLLKPKFTTKSPEVRTLGDTPAFPPRERLRRIQALVANHFGGIRFGGARTRFGAPVRRSRSVLPLPGLIFGPADEPTRVLPGDLRGDGEWEARRRWGQQKLALLGKHGPYRKATFTNPAFVYPAGLEEEGLFEQFLRLTADFCERYGKVSFTPEPTSYRDGAHPREIIAKLKGLADAGHVDFILQALPENSDQADQAYAGIKTRIALPSKCFSTAKLRAEARDQQRFVRYVERNALGLLVENGTRPWGLAEPLAYEMHFGFDVARTRHGGLMGAAVVADIAASDIVFGYKEIDSRERIPPQIIGKFVLDHLNRFFDQHGRPPRSIVFQRDGRLLEVERNGLRRALAKFVEAHPGMAPPVWTAVSIEKTMSVPLRLFRDEPGSVARSYSGSIFLQNDRVGYLVTAGDPSLRQGTPRPLRIEIVDASAGHAPDLTTLLRDIFWLSQLNWSSPEIDISLPITLRFTDEKLERYSLELEDEADEGDWDTPTDDMEQDSSTALQLQEAQTQGPEAARGGRT